jgi:hypothetical protein
MLILIRSAESTRLKLPRFSADMYGQYYGEDNMSLTVPIFASNFFREIIPVSAALTLVSLLVYLVAAAPIVAFAAYLSEIQFELIRTPSLGVLEKVSVLAGLFIIASSAAFVILFNIPLPMQKNSFRIRWGVLSRLYPIGMHPRMLVWLERS